MPQRDIKAKILEELEYLSPEDQAKVHKLVRELRSKKSLSTRADLPLAIPPKIDDPDLRDRRRHEFVEALRANPLRPGFSRFTRDDLHARH